MMGKWIRRNFPRFISHSAYIHSWTFNDTVRSMAAADSVLDVVLTTITEYHTLTVIIDRLLSSHPIRPIGLYSIEFDISFRLGVSAVLVFRSLRQSFRFLPFFQRVFPARKTEIKAISAIPEDVVMYGYHGEAIVESADMRRIELLKKSRAIRLWKGSQRHEWTHWKRLEIPGRNA